MRTRRIHCNHNYSARPRGRADVAVNRFAQRIISRRFLLLSFVDSNERINAHIFSI